MRTVNWMSVHPYLDCENAQNITTRPITRSWEDRYMSGVIIIFLTHELSIFDNPSVFEQPLSQVIRN